MPARKEAVNASDSAPEETKETPVQDEAENLSDDDVKALESAKSVPYSRFKEKNEEAKALKSQLEAVEERHRSEVERLIHEQEALRALKSKENEAIFDVEDDSDKEIKGLKTTITSLTKKLENLEGVQSQAQLSMQIEKLQAKYPEADTLAVLGWKKHKPDIDLEEAMEMSHNRNLERGQKLVKDLIEKKKAKKESSIPTKEFGFKLKDSEKPKTVQDAARYLKSLVRDL